MSEFPYIPLDTKGWRMAMGLRPLDLDHWLEVDDRRDDELAQKRQLLDTAFDVVVATTPDGDAGSAELLAEVASYLETHHREIAVQVDVNEHPVVAASRLVQEDLCVLVRTDVWRLQAASVCFPSRWNLASKLGTSLDDIHLPLPLYYVELSRPTNAFFKRLGPERSFWRLNWTLIDSATLHQPTSARRSPHGELADWFFRVERQTLRRLPMSGAIVFTIRNYVASAKELCNTHEEFGATLLKNLDTAPTSMREYKGWIGVADRLRTELGGPSRE